MFKIVFLSFFFHFIIVHSMFYSRKSIKRLQGDLGKPSKKNANFMTSGKKVGGPKTKTKFQKNKLKMAYSRDLPKISRQQCGIMD